MNVQMIEADVRKSAQKIQAAANNVKGIDFSDSISAITSALPGSTCMSAANKLKTELKTNLDGWVKSANSHHELTNNAADHIVEADHTSERTGNRLNQQVGQR
ncbi:hypothetical protein GCM10010197_21270 [Nocardioides luteus]|uniref:ESX-1 secretion-associated protein n=2 Tax=Nocardioides luteus TaxID=1844 RepID=A0ABQ5T2Z2_9ACTN|nr:hypothetical protein [Nocardioides luteus]GGR54526.1 hypothetical protein GCM10010197_21270 [Nocardioides luteus]GLJ70245.1 hypothetical protein GCM10017579_42810 [Nocardioides luteus]